MRMKRLLMVLLIAVFSFSFTATGARAADLVKLPTAWMDEHETFLIWYAKEKGCSMQGTEDPAVESLNVLSDERQVWK